MRRRGTTCLVLGFLSVGLTTVLLNADQDREKVRSPDDKILVVKDGSVELIHNNSKLGNLTGKKHKWEVKADTVEISNGPDSKSACDNIVAPAAAFTSVTFVTISGLKIVAQADSADNKLTLELPDGYSFGWHHYRRVLFSGAIPVTQGLSKITVQWKTGGNPVDYNTGSLCATFQGS
jgi:hypothetical protein